MALKGRADAEGVDQRADDLFLLGRQPQRVCGVDGGKALVEKIVFASFQKDCAAPVVDFLKQCTLLHPPLGMRAVELSLEFELHDAHGLVHLGYEACIFLRRHWPAIHEARCEEFTRVIGIMLNGKGGQRHHVDGVPFLQRTRVGIAQGKTEHRAHAGRIARRCTEPKDVVVTPLDVPSMVVAQSFKDEMRTWPTVEDVAQYVQAVYGELLDKLADGRDEMVGPACAYDGADDDVDILLLVAIVTLLMQQFFNDVCKIFRQCLAYP